MRFTRRIKERSKSLTVLKQENDKNRSPGHDNVVHLQEPKKQLRPRTYSSNAIKARNVEVGSGDFDKVRLIGRGDVGKVYLVREKKSGQLYAMKSMYIHVCFFGGEGLV